MPGPARCDPTNDSTEVSAVATGPRLGQRGDRTRRLKVRSGYDEGSSAPRSSTTRLVVQARPRDQSSHDWYATRSGGLALSRCEGDARHRRRHWTPQRKDGAIGLSAPCLHALARRGRERTDARRLGGRRDRVRHGGDPERASIHRDGARDAVEMDGVLDSRGIEPHLRDRARNGVCNPDRVRRDRDVRDAPVELDGPESASIRRRSARESAA
jgi:hypothetical protein